jgi:AraC-like DNA-binding protein
MSDQTDKHDVKEVLLAGARQVFTTCCPEEFPEDRADDSFKPDRHLHREILFILHGESRFLLNGLVYDARPGVAFLLNKWEVHSYGYRKDDHDLLHLWIHFSDDRMYGSLVRVSCAGQYRPAGSHMNFNEDLHQLLKRRWNMLEKIPECDSGVKDLLIKPVLNIVFEEFAMFQFGMIEYPKENTSDITVFLRNYIRNTNGRGCSLENLEKLSGYSRFHLTRLFREQCGKTIGEYINDIRLHFVKEADKRGLKQKEIAVELGFSSPAAFWYWLQKHK